MEQHGLKQGDMPDIGSQGVVSELLSGKRELNRNRSPACRSASASARRTFF